MINIILTVLFFHVAAISGSSYDKATEPWFAETVPNITAIAGRDVELPCIVESLGKYQVAWLQMDQNIILTIKVHTITSDPRISLLVRQKRIWSLQIRAVQVADSGRYLCQLNTSPMKNNIGFLQVVVPPEISVSEQQVGATIGTDVTLVCNLESHPKSVTYWRRDDGNPMIISNSKYNSVELDAGYKVQMRLIIKNLRPDDFGSYTCVAKNSVGEAEGTITLSEMTELKPSTKPSTDDIGIIRSKTPPKIRIQDQLVGATIGENVTLGCTAESSLSTVNYWTREDDGTILITNSKYMVNPFDLFIYGAEMRLIIKDLHPDDFGSYICVSKNSEGETKGTITLYDKEPLTSTYAASDELASSVEEIAEIAEPHSLPQHSGSTARIAPKIRTPNRRLGASIGGNVTLRCNLKSNPKSVTYWTKEGGEMMIISNTKYNSFIVDSGINKVQMTLIIKNTSPDDFGSYTCVAKNSVGEAEGTITVYEKPEPQSVLPESNTDKMPPNIEIPNQLVGAAIGSNATLVCNLKSNPRSIVYWTREGSGFMVIPNTKYNSHLIETGNYTEQMRLIIKNLGPDDFGSYTCVAKNSVGEAEGNITLYEIPEPHSSTNPSSEGLGSNAAEKISEPHSSTYPSSEISESNAAESDEQDVDGSLMWTTLSTIILRLLF